MQVSKEELYSKADIISLHTPLTDEMINLFGSPSDWQEQSTYIWIDKLLFEVPNDIIFFEGQVNLFSGSI